MLLRAIMSVSVVTLGILPGCDSGTASKDLAARDREIAALKQEIASLSAKPGNALPAPATPAATPAAPASATLDADIVRAAASAAGVQKLKLECEADGSVREVSLYHADAAAVLFGDERDRSKTEPGAADGALS